jgi:2-polyprenyl-3-methyl-5-hydroxy-6-metoxy-1,4-benzoquinol methylase
MTCIVCGTPQSVGLAEWHAACDECGYESAALRGAVEPQGRVSIDEDARERGMRALREENFRDIVDIACLFTRTSARRLLDVGCAHGSFLERAAERFEALGIEPDAELGRRAAARGLPVRLGHFPGALRPGECFDVIVFNDVIEHIPDIGAALDACYAHLNEGGLLILTLPSSEGFFYRLSKTFARIGWRSLFERLWQKDLPSPHVHYFRPGNLERLVARHGFDCIHVSELSAMTAKGLLERIRYAGNISRPSLYLQYAAARCALPLLRILPSDIVVSVFRRQ